MLRESDTILVTGGLGFIGSHLINYILKGETSVCHIYNLDALRSGSNRSNIDYSNLDCSRYTLLVGDINDVATMNFPKPNIILNLAAETHVDRSICNPGQFVNSNYLGVYRLLEYARKNDISKFVQVSTDEVYGESPIDYSFNEDDNLMPGNPYSATKAAADLLSISYMRTYGLNVSITRCTNNFGPNQGAEKLIPLTIIRILKGLPILLYGDGQQVRDWLYVNDHVTAICEVMKSVNANGIYNISASNLLSNYELVQKINRLSEEFGGKSSSIENVQDRPGHDKRYSLNSTKIRTQLKWKPTFDFDVALLRTVKWYMRNEKWLFSSANQHQTNEFKILDSI